MLATGTRNFSPGQHKLDIPPKRKCRTVSKIPLQISSHHHFPIQVEIFFNLIPIPSTPSTYWNFFTGAQNLLFLKTESRTASKHKILLRISSYASFLYLGGTIFKPPSPNQSVIDGIRKFAVRDLKLGSYSKH